MLLSREQVRMLDARAIQDYGIPALVLMENAGRGVADVLAAANASGSDGAVLICCGKGNNGGDGLVAARHLANRGFTVKILLFAASEQLSAECAVHWKIVQKMRLPCRICQDKALDEPALARDLSGMAWVIDALFGTGLTGPLRPPFDRIVTLINESKAKVLAVDIPSGLDADTGRPLGAAIRADHAVTFVAEKKGFANPAAAAWLGTVHVADIGVPTCLIQDIASGANS